MPGTPRRVAHTVAQGFDPCFGASRWRASTLRPRGHLIALRRNPTRLRRPLSATRRGSDRVLVVARQKDDPVAALDDRIGSQGGRNQVIESFHELGAGERLRDEGGGREAVQLFKENSKMTLQRPSLPSSRGPPDELIQTDFVAASRVASMSSMGLFAPIGKVDMKSAPGPVRASRTDRRSDRSRP